MRLKRSKKFRNGTFSDKGSQPRSRGLETQTYQVYKAVPKSGWREALTSVNKWALLECGGSGQDGGKEATFKSPWLQASKGS